MKWFFGGMVLTILGILAIFFVFSREFPLEKKVIEEEVKQKLALEAKPTEFIPSPTPTPVDYSAYTFEALSQRKYESGKIKLGRVLKKENNYTSYIFTYQSDGKTISGVANIPFPADGGTQGKPKGEGKFPVIVLIRGYVDREIYYIGLGTEHSADFLADNGFITLAPDFLGFGTSDQEDPDILVARFQCPAEVLNLISSINSLPQADSTKIGLWGHSNGGQIALSILEITGKPYPTALWAPVSLGFPESILVYLGGEDVGNIVKVKIDDFSTYNDPKNFSIEQYFSKIKTTSFIVHQATNDEMIKVEWTNSLTEELKNNGNSVNLYLYPKENHNFNRYKTTGDVLRQRDLEFFKKYLFGTN